jgi:hypothetical protein
MLFSSIMIYSLTTKRLKKASFGKDSIIMVVKGLEKWPWNNTKWTLAPSRNVRDITHPNTKYVHHLFQDRHRKSAQFQASCFSHHILEISLFCQSFGVKSYIC